MKNDDAGGDKGGGEGSDECDLKLFEELCFLTDIIHSQWTKRWMDIGDCWAGFLSENVSMSLTLCPMYDWLKIIIWWMLLWMSLTITKLQLVVEFVNVNKILLKCYIRFNHYE